MKNIQDATVIPLQKTWIDFLVQEQGAVNLQHMPLEEVTECYPQALVDSGCQEYRCKQKVVTA